MKKPDHMIVFELRACRERLRGLSAGAEKIAERAALEVVKEYYDDSKKQKRESHVRIAMGLVERKTGYDTAVSFLSDIIERAEIEIPDAGHSPAQPEAALVTEKPADGGGDVQ